MLGFSEILSGGLGDGGFFRISAQAAERARIIRVALADFFNQVIDIHTMKRYGVVFPENNRPWNINFYGSISALETERQKTKADAMNAGLLLLQGIQMLKEMNAPKDVMHSFLSKEFLLDEDEAKLLATIADVKEPDNGGGFGGNNNFGGDE
jgi:hypothetical protein